jgi:SAM-dependent methyltransferase
LTPRRPEVSFPGVADSPPERIASEIQAYYALGLEASRLDEGYFPLEEARTRELIGRSLPPGPLRVLDVGGASGRYALWLAAQGHEVHLIDPVPLHVEQARAASGSAARPLASTGVGEARRLELSDACFDALLLLGPLYHLPERADRLAALGEARRVLKPGGWLFAAAISRFAALLDWLGGGPRIADAEFREIALADARHGRHVNTTGRPEIFTTAYFHRPEELRQELRQAGLAPIELLAVEGPGALVRDFATAWREPGLRKSILAGVRLVEREGTLIGMSPHLLAVARRPGAARSAG